MMTWAAAVLLGVFLAAGTALAIDQPPQGADQQRDWLVGHLVGDMQALGTFDGNTLAKLPGIVKGLTDDQVALLAQYYFLTRSKTEQDAAIYAMQQQRCTVEQLNAARAEIADLLAAMNDQIEACYAQFAPMPQPVQYVAQTCYASVPGWCCGVGCYVPGWYYANGCFVGPCLNAAYAGAWAVPVCNVYYDHHSHFYSVYGNVAKTVHIDRSIRSAKGRADWFRSQGDWHKTLAHDRFLHQGQQNVLARVRASSQNHMGNRAVAVRNVHAAAVRTKASHVRVGNHKPIAHAQNVQVRSRKPVARPAKASVRHVSAPHRRAARSAAHAARSRPAVHAQAHTRSGGHSKRR